MKMIAVSKLKDALLSFKGKAPFDHCIIDDFLDETVAQKIASDFIDYDDTRWHCYKNPLEDKKALNDWNAFPSQTYQLFNELLSNDFVDVLSDSVGLKLYPDPGLHGGGWHIHSSSGNLNPHFDYSIHPKLRLQRKLNIIIYVSPELKAEHGGHLGLWMHDHNNNEPGVLVHEIQPKFNRAVVFDTTQNSWHGMSRPLVQPEGIYRKSLAIYYLCDPVLNADLREKALFAPRDDQKDLSEIKCLIERRSDPEVFSTAYISRD